MTQSIILFERQVICVRGSDVLNKPIMRLWKRKTFDCNWSLLFRSIFVLLSVESVNDATVLVLTFPIDGLRQDVSVIC
jgi:hypothetical protein